MAILCPVTLLVLACESREAFGEKQLHAIGAEHRFASSQNDNENELALKLIQRSIIHSHTGFHVSLFPTQRFS